MQEVADLRIDDVDLDRPLRIRLHGKGDKWRSSRSGLKRPNC